MKLHCPSRSSTLSRRGSPTPLKPFTQEPAPPSDTSSARTQLHHRNTVAHTYTLEQASFPYVTLALNSGAASPDQMPVFRGACPVTGEVVLELSKLKAIKDVLITVEGRLFTPSGQVTSFLSHTLSLFTPALPQPAPQTSTIDGTYTLPFSFTFPSVGSNGSPLPTSWTSALSPNTKIEYVFSLRIKRKSRAARRVCGDDVLNVPIVFHPRVRHDEKQAMVAWSAGGTAGEWPTERGAWHLSTATIRGSQVGQRDKPLRATLGLANPLVYPMHTTLPFTITLSDETQAAPDVLSAPIAISVDLRRAVRYVPSVIPHASVWCIGCGFATAKCICPKSMCSQQLGAQEWTWETVAVAKCWQVPHASRNMRVVRGEIELDGPLEPSFSFGGLNVSYAVHVRFSAPTPSQANQEEHFTFVEPVALVSDLAPEEASTRLSTFSSSTPSMTSAPSSYAPSHRSVSPTRTSLSSQHSSQLSSQLSKTLSYSPTPSAYADLPPSYDVSQSGYGLARKTPPSPPYSRSSSEERELQMPVSVRSRAPAGAVRMGRPSEKRLESWMRMEMQEDDVLLA